MSEILTIKNYTITFSDYFCRVSSFTIEAISLEFAELEATAALDYSEGWGNYNIESIEVKK